MTVASMSLVFTALAVFVLWVAPPEWPPRGFPNRFLASIAARLISIQIPAKVRPSSTSADDLHDATQLLAEADRLLIWLSNSTAARPLYEKAETLATLSGDENNATHARVGRIRSQVESIPLAEVSNLLAAELKNPLVRKDPELRLFCLAAKGYTDIDVNVASSRTAWQQALETARSLKDARWESRASGELGIIAFLQGDGEKAEHLVGAALLSAMAQRDVAAQIRYLTMIGNGLADLKRYPEAAEFFSRALRLADSTKDFGFPFMAYEGQARSLLALNQPAQARKLLSAALEEARKRDKRGHEAQILILLGKVSLATNDIVHAVAYLQAAGELSRSTQFYRVEGEAMSELAAIYRAQGKLREAENCLRRGIEVSRAVGDTYFLPRDLSSLAELDANRGHLTEADELWEQATDIVEGLLINAPSPGVKRAMIAAMSDIYVQRFVRTAKENNVDKAFSIVERARGRSVAESLWDRASSGPSTHAGSAVEEQISALQLELMSTDTRKRREELLEQLFDAEQKRAYIVDGSYPRRSAVWRPASLRDTQRILSKEELLLEYVLADPNSYCVAVTRSHAQAVSLPSSRQQIEALADDYLAQVKARKPDDEAGRRLYALLLAAPIQALGPQQRIVVIPDGILHLVPFDALRTPDDKYLLESSVVTYAPSATVLRFLRTSNRSVPRLPFLGVGDVNLRGLFDLAGAHFQSLPGTRDEVVDAGQIFGSGSVVLLGSEATEATFKRQPLAQFRVLHLAVHATSSPQFPERAALVLGKDAGSNDDGLLQTNEISNLVLNADLVTLSACDTGIGRLLGEEGIASLQRAFLLAGAQSTVATLWSADDTFTETLIKQFYRYLATGMDKGSALRQAKIDILAEFGDKALPFYWAGVVMDGEAGSGIASRR